MNKVSISRIFLNRLWAPRTLKYLETDITRPLT